MMLDSIPTPRPVNLGELPSTFPLLFQVHAKKPLPTHCTEAQPPLSSLCYSGFQSPGVSALDALKPLVLSLCPRAQDPVFSLFPLAAMSFPIILHYQNPDSASLRLCL